MGWQHALSGAISKSFVSRHRWEVPDVSLRKSKRWTLRTRDRLEMSKQKEMSRPKRVKQKLFSSHWLMAVTSKPKRTKVSFCNSDDHVDKVFSYV